MPCTSACLLKQLPPSNARIPSSASCRYYVAYPSHGEAARGVVKDSSDREIAGKLELLKGISFHAEPGRLTALMGGSGAGGHTCTAWMVGQMRLLAGRPRGA